MIKYDDHTIKISCSANQCKRKQWCKRYQLYLHTSLEDKDIDKISWKSFVSPTRRAKLRQLINNCKHFMPTEQYLTKEKLKKLDTFYKN